MRTRGETVRQRGSIPPGPTLNDREPESTPKTTRDNDTPPTQISALRLTRSCAASCVYVGRHQAARPPNSRRTTQRRHQHVQLHVPIPPARQVQLLTLRYLLRH